MSTGGAHVIQTRGLPDGYDPPSMSLDAVILDNLLATAPTITPRRWPEIPRPYADPLACWGCGLEPDPRHRRALPAMHSGPPFWMPHCEWCAELSDAQEKGSREDREERRP
jgi:hypothetical protein